MFGRRKKDANESWTVGAVPPQPARLDGEFQAPVPGIGVGGQPTVQVISGGASPEQIQQALEMARRQGVVVPSQEQITQAIQAAEQFVGRDLDGDGKVTGAAPAAGADLASQLERLAALKASGALTDEEFAAQKAKLLGS